MKKNLKIEFDFEITETEGNNPDEVTRVVMSTDGYPILEMLVVNKEDLQINEFKENVEAYGVNAMEYVATFRNGFHTLTDLIYMEAQGVFLDHLGKSEDKEHIAKAKILKEKTKDSMNNADEVSLSEAKQILEENK